jgi:hypothetical protein
MIEAPPDSTALRVTIDRVYTSQPTPAKSFMTALYIP